MSTQVEEAIWTGWSSGNDLQALMALGRRLERPVREAAITARELLIGRLLKIRDKQGALVPLVHNRAQAEFAAQATGRDLVLKARQLGITTWIAARFFVATVTRPGTVTVLVAHDKPAAEEIFRIVHRFLDHLPKRLRRGALVTSRDNIGQVVFPWLDSEYRVESAADSNAGRGLTIQYLHCSEVARWPRDAAATLASLRAAVPPSGEIVLESTPNGAAGAFYDEWQRADASGYRRHFFPWWYEPAYRVDGPRFTADGREPGDAEFFRRGTASAVPNRHSDSCHSEGALAPEESAFANGQRQMANGTISPDDLSTEEQTLVETHHLTLAQIAFRRRIRENFRGLARQEFAEDPISCFLSSGECVFDIDVVNQRLAECSAEIRVANGQRPMANGGPIQARDNSRLLIWWPPRPGADYIIGVDPAGGGCEGDYSCVQLIERVTGLQCAELHGHIPPQELATRLAALGREYNDALIAVERNNHGHGVIAYLAAWEKYPRLYEQNRQTGWLTTAVSRPRMIEQFAALLTRQPGLFASPRLLSECRTFVRQLDGSAAAAAGTHDDCVMAMAIAQAVRLELAGGHHPRPELDFASLAR